MDSKTDAATPAPTLSTERASDTAKFSLGAHLLGFPAADDRAAPTRQQEQEPGAWLVEFRAKHAGRAVYQGVFTSCPAGRDWVLRDASKATLQLDTTQQHDPQQWQRQLCAIKAALLTRGTAPTTLVLTADDTEHSTTTMTNIASHLQSAAAGVTGLRVKCKGAGRHRKEVPEQQHNAVAAFLQSAKAALPHLLTIELVGHDMSNSAAEVVAAVSQYLPQITSLTLNTFGMAWPWPALFTQPTALTHFSTTSRLDDTLLPLLLKYAPALTHLTVYEIYLSCDYSKERWALQYLVVAKGTDSIRLDSLAQLPASAVRVQTFAFSLGVDVYLEGLTPSVRERLPQFSFTTQAFKLRWSSLLTSADHQTAGLDRAVEQLRELKVPNVEMWLGGGWDDPAALARASKLFYEPRCQGQDEGFSAWLARTEMFSLLRQLQYDTLWKRYFNC